MKREPKTNAEERGYYIIKQPGFGYQHTREEYEGSFEEIFRTPRACLNYSPEIKLEVTTFATQNTNKQAAKKYGISVRLIKRWIQEYKLGGRAAFYEGEINMEEKESKINEICDPTENYPIKAEERPEEGAEPIPEEKVEENTQSQDKQEATENTTSATPNTRTHQLTTQGTLTVKHVRLNPSNPKLPNVEGWEKVNLISPSLRLWAAKEGIKNGCQKTAISVGVSNNTLQRWISAYKTMGDEAHIFKTNYKRYSGVFNGGRGKGVEIYSEHDKKEIIDKALKVNNRTRVAYRLGISPGTITQWMKKLNYPPKKYLYSNELDEGIPLPDWYSNKCKPKPKHKRMHKERSEFKRWKFIEPMGEAPSSICDSS